MKESKSRYSPASRHVCRLRIAILSFIRINPLLVTRKKNNKKDDQDRIFAKEVSVEVLFQAVQMFLPFFFIIHELTMFYIRCWWTFSVKRQTINVSGFLGFEVSVTTVHLCHCSSKAAIATMSVNRHGSSSKT